MNLHKFKKYSRMALKKMIHFLRSELFLRFGILEPLPEKVYYLMTNKCNYQCQMCPQWKAGFAEQALDYIEESRLKVLITEMARLGISEFGISGGEPLLYQEKMFSLLEFANNKGLYTHFVSNGALISHDILEKYNNIGGGHVSLSIDAIGEKHDSLRGYAGAYANALKVLKLFREHKYPNLVLKINIVLSNGNLSDIVSVINLGLESRALIFIQPYDTYDYGQRDIEKKQQKFPLWVKNESYLKLEKVMADVLVLKKKFPAQILNDEKHLLAFNEYFRDSGFSTKCLAALDQISINPFGQITFCKYGVFGDLKKSSLKEFFKSSERKNIVKASLECKEGCLLGCMFRPSFLGMVRNGARQFVGLVK